jgi:hypothetical protein
MCCALFSPVEHTEFELVVELLLLLLFVWLLLLLFVVEFGVVGVVAVVCGVGVTVVPFGKSSPTVTGSLQGVTTGILVCVTPAASLLESLARSLVVHGVVAGVV